jgi:hypothetical protein
MQKFKMQMEAQIQEIVFFFSLLLSFTVFISGVFSLALTPENVVYILGNFGSAINQGLFSVFGFAFFYLSVMILHMGYVTNMHVFSFKDFKREYQVLSISALAHAIILVMFSTILSVVQIYLGIQNGEFLTSGNGGFVGHAFGQILYSGLGVYGSVTLLLIASFATSLIAGFYELNDVLETIKNGAVKTKIHTIKAARKINHSLIQTVEFILKDHEMVAANVSLASSKAWMSNSINKANNFFTDHFHINTNSITSLLDRKPETKEKAKKTVVRKSTAKSTKAKITNPIKSLTARKPKKKIIAVKKSSKESEISKR